MHLDDNKKIIWIITADYWTGDILDLEIKVVEANLAGGSSCDEKGNVDVELLPKKSDCEKCGFEKEKVIDTIKNNRRYKERILQAVYSNEIYFRNC